MRRIEEVKESESQIKELLKNAESKTKEILSKAYKEGSERGDLERLYGNIFQTIHL